MTFRQGTIDDVDQLRKLALISYGQFQHVLTQENWNKLRLNLERETFFPDLLKISRSFICEHASEIIGMAFLVPKGNPTEIFEAGWSCIRMVGVHPDFAAQGIGKALTQRCIDVARSSGEQVVVLHTSEYMDAARHIYESLGFVRSKELEPRYGKRYWVYKLEL